MFVAAQTMTREQFVRIEVGKYVDTYKEKEFVIEVGEVEKFIIYCQPLIVEFDRSMREYIDRLPGLDMAPEEREVLLSNHSYRAEQVCQKLEMLTRLYENNRNKRMPPVDYLVVFRIIGIMGSIRGELQAMEKRIF